MTHPLSHTDGGALPANLMTVAEAARFLGQPVEDVFRSVICDRLPVVWLGPRPYVDRDALPDDLRQVGGQEPRP